MRKQLDEIQQLGSILSAKRKRLNISIEQASEATKIRVDYLSLLEKGDYTKLPSEVYTKGFIQNYSKFLGLNPQVSLAIYRREQDSVEKTTSLKNPKRRKKGLFSFRLTQERLLGIGILLVILVFVFYLITRINAVVKPPEFSISSPAEISAGSEQTFRSQEDTITIRGKLEVGATLMVNDSEFNTRNLEIFEITDLVLAEGENLFDLKATSQFGVEAQIILKVIKKTVEDSSSSEKENFEQEAELSSMLVEIIVGPREANIKVIIDGGEVQNWVEKAGSVKTYKAKNSVKIQTPRPDSVRVAINGAEKKVETTDQIEWILIDGQVIKRK